MPENAETRQPACEQAGDPIRKDDIDLRQHRLRKRIMRTPDAAMAMIIVVPTPTVVLVVPSSLQFSSRFEDFEVRALGTLPIRGSPASTSSHARCADDSKSGASTGRTCQPVTGFPNTSIERMFGNSRRKLWWWSSGGSEPYAVVRTVLGSYRASLLQRQFWVDSIMNTGSNELLHRSDLIFAEDS